MKDYGNRQYNGYCQGYTEVPDDIPTDAEIIWLAGNQIKSLKANTFNHTQCLSLAIIWDVLETVEVGAFNNLTNLLNLHLHHNRLLSLPVEIFSALPSLFSLEMQNNKLESLSQGIFSFKMDEWQDTLYMSISENPLICNSSLCWLYTAEEDRSVKWSRGIWNTPECTGLRTWSQMNLICDEKGKYSKTPMRFRI